MCMTTADINRTTARMLIAAGVEPELVRRAFDTTRPAAFLADAGICDGLLVSVGL